MATVLVKMRRGITVSSALAEYDTETKMFTIIKGNEQNEAGDLIGPWGPTIDPWDEILPGRSIWEKVESGKRPSCFFRDDDEVEQIAQDLLGRDPEDASPAERQLVEDTIEELGLG